ncbi:Iron-sulfur assembly protein 1 [Metarhizium anisopliae]|nr:Iron-sulfur assembly protein 1 [Metarhizium anisopliae]
MPHGNRSPIRLSMPLSADLDKTIDCFFQQTPREIQHEQPCQSSSTITELISRIQFGPHAAEMNARTLVARVALRQSCHSLRQISARRQFASAYHSYSLPTSTTRNVNRDSIPETPIAPPEALPQVHETRPPPRQATPATPPSTPDSKAPAKELAKEPASISKASEPAAQKPRATRPRPKLRPRKAAMKLTPAAVEQLRSMLDQPEPKIIKVGVRNRGCSGLAYHLEYVDKPGTFDEMVEQDGVKVLIDSKALFSIIGTEMDWAEDKLNQRFVFKNPNIKEQCGCGESFMV